MMTWGWEGRCAQCGEPMALAEGTYTALKRNSQGFTCPWGHANVFPAGEAEINKVRRERDRLKQQEARLRERISEEQERAATAERRASAARGQVTRLKNRAAAGLCPCCNRSFVNLQRHMATKHKGFLAEDVETGASVH